MSNRPEPQVIDETVRVTKQFLEAELAKYKTFKEFKTLINKSLNFSDERSFQISKSKGIGEPTIVNFLGKGWEKKGWAVR